MRGGGVGSRTSGAVYPRPVAISLPDVGTGRTKTNGYDYKHKSLRRKWAKQIAAGTVLCARCGKLIQPFALWDLGHDDTDRTRYAGPEHRKCNRATAGRGKRAKWRSRKW
jgi:hypothetical protein